MKNVAVVLLVFMAYLAMLLISDNYEYMESINPTIIEYELNKVTNLYEYKITYNDKTYIVRTNRYYKEYIDLDVYKLHLFRSVKLKTRSDKYEQSSINVNTI